MKFLLEKELEKKFVKRVSESGGMALKFVSPGKSGVPDRVVLMPGGKVAFAELKRPGGEIRPIQRRTIEQFRSLGAKVRIVDSEAEIERFIREVMGGDANA